MSLECQEGGDVMDVSWQLKKSRLVVQRQRTTRSRIQVVNAVRRSALVEGGDLTDVSWQLKKSRLVVQRQRTTRSPIQVVNAVRRSGLVVLIEDAYAV